MKTITLFFVTCLLVISAHSQDNVPEPVKNKNDLFRNTLTTTSYQSVLPAVPQTMSYQGLLTTSSGTPVADGSYTLQIELYDSLTGGTQQWTDTFTPTLSRGTFDVILGSGASLGVVFNKKMFVQVTATAGPAGPSYPLTFSPRSELTSAPYALAPWVTNGNNIYYNSGAVGIGTSNPSSSVPFLRLDIADEDGNVSDIALRVAGTLGGYPVINFAKSRGTLSVPAIVNNNEISGLINFRSYDGSAFRSLAYIWATVDGIPGALDMPGALRFATTADGASGPVERMRITNGGSIGIGTISPQSPLVVQGFSNWGVSEIIGTGTNVESSIGFRSSNLAKGALGTWVLGVNNNAGAPNAFSLYAANGLGAGSQVISVLPSGNVGVGAPTPAGKLHIEDANWASAPVLIKGLSGAVVGPTIEMDATDGTSGERYSIISTNSGAASGGGKLGIYHNGPTGGGYRFVVDVSGNVGIGTTAPAARLHVNGTAGNNTGVWSNLSDRRLKRDIQPLHSALMTVEQLQPVTFRWNDEKKDAEFGNVRGLIAQDVENVIPEWVRTDPDGFKRIEPIGVDALLIQAIKELSEKNEILVNRLAEMELKLEELTEKENNERKSLGELK